MQKMQQISLLGALSLVAACASNTEPTDPRFTDTTQPIVLDCPDGWAKCVTTARKVCGPKGFDEIDRSRDVNMTSLGRLDEQSDGRHIYREDTRIEQENQVMVIQCR